MPRKKPLFEVDKTAFDPEVEARDRAKESSPKARMRRGKLTLEDVLKAAADLGLQVSIPSSDQDKALQESSLVKLGFKETKVEEVNSTKELKGILYTRHFIAGTAYGPGEFTLSYLEKDLYNSLLQQDQAAMRGIRDTVDFNPSGRSFIIARGNGKDRFNKYRKVEVSSANFNRAMFEVTAVSAGKIDAAGYVESTSTQGSF